MKLKIYMKLIEACKNNDINCVQNILLNNHDIDCNFTFSDLNSDPNMLELYRKKYYHIYKTDILPLFYAYNNNNILMIELLLEYGANINIRDYNNKTLLYYAYTEQKIDIIDNIITKYNGNIDEIYIDGELLNKETILFCACKYNDLDAVEKFINCGANIYYTNSKNHTILHVAFLSGSYTIVDLLINKYNFNINILFFDNYNLKKRNLSINHQTKFHKILKLLLNNENANINYTWLYKLSYNNIKILEILINKIKYSFQYKYNKQIFDNYTAFYMLKYAYMHKNMNIVDIVIDNLDLFYLNKFNNESADNGILHKICHFNDVNLFKKVYNYYIDNKLIHKYDKYKNRLLHIVCNYNSYNILDYLLYNHKIMIKDIGAFNSPKFTCLHNIIINNSIECMNIILEKKYIKLTDKTIIIRCDDIGKNILHMICENVKHDNKLIDLLMKFKNISLLLNIEDKNGDTPLAISCKFENLSMIDILLKNGVPISDELLNKYKNNNKIYKSLTRINSNSKSASKICF